MVLFPDPVAGSVGLSQGDDEQRDTERHRETQRDTEGAAKA